MKINLYKCYNRLVNQLDTRFDSMSYLQIVFVGLSSQAILEDTEGELGRKFKILGSEYVSRLLLEIRLWDVLAIASKLECDMTMMIKSSAIKWLRWIYRWQVQEIVPNILIALRLFLTLTFSIAAAERNFSKQKLIKGYLRSSISQDHLSDLTLILTEQETREGRL